jgi:glutamyl-tRNA reductase
VFIANRRYDRAIGLAQRFGGRAVRFDQLPEQLVAADIVVASTSSPHHVVERDALAEVIGGRAGRPLILIDLAVPRDIHPSCRDVPGVSVFDMDDLQALVERNASGREGEAQRATALIRSEVERFERWLATQDALPTVAALRRRADEIVAAVLAENDARWENLSDADRERVDKLAHAVASRLLHDPTLRLKRAAGEDGSYIYVHALRELFGLDAEAAPLAADDAEVRSLPDERRRRSGR